MKRRYAAALLAAALICGGASSPPAGLTVSAKVDKTTVDVGAPFTLTLTLTGDLSGVQIPPPVFPEGLAVTAQSQATNLSMQGGVIERSTLLVFVLLPTRDGTFRLGPFSVTRNDQSIETEPIEVTVKKPAVPPTLKPDASGRFTL